MLKLTNLALGLLAVIAIAPSSQAATVNSTFIVQPTASLHAENFRREVRQERREIRHDRHAIRHEGRAMRHERHEHREMRHHN